MDIENLDKEIDTLTTLIQEISKALIDKNRQKDNYLRDNFLKRLQDFLTTPDARILQWDLVERHIDWILTCTPYFRLEYKNIFSKHITGQFNETIEFSCWDDEIRFSGDLKALKELIKSYNLRIGKLPGDRLISAINTKILRINYLEETKEQTNKQQEELKQEIKKTKEKISIISDIIAVDTSSIPNYESL